MNRIVSLIGIAFLTLVFFLLQIYALDAYLYWRFWWFDMVMHGLGGVAIGAVVLWFLIFEYSIPSHRVLLVSLGAVLLVGISWEIFENVMGWEINRFWSEYALDTMVDLVMDVLGTYAVYLVCSRIWESRSQ